MRYRKTYLNILHNEPLSKYDLIQKQAIVEDLKYTESLVTHKPLKYKVESPLKKGNILRHFYKNYVLIFKP